MQLLKQNIWSPPAAQDEETQRGTKCVKKSFVTLILAKDKNTKKKTATQITRQVQKYSTQASF